MLTINSINNQCRKPQIAFNGARNTKPKQVLPQEVIDHFGLNMKSRVGYKGKPDYEPAPDNIQTDLKEFFRMMKINWKTHFDPSKPRRRFQ